MTAVAVLASHLCPGLTSLPWPHFSLPGEVGVVPSWRCCGHGQRPALIAFLWDKLPVPNEGKAPGATCPE